MKQINGLIKLILVSIILVTYSCSKDDSTITNLDKTITNSKTSLFEKVIAPELTEGRTLGREEIFLESTSESSDIDVVKGKPNGQFESGVLTAGEWNDLDNWDFWNNLLSDQEYYDDVNKWKLKQIKRYSFVVEDKNESPVANAEISLLINKVEIWKTKTDNNGKATLWSDLKLNGVTALVEIEAIKKNIREVKEYTEGINKVHLNKAIVNKKIIDIYFAVDATGSMGDEINYLKVELNNVIQRIKQNNPLLKMRFGSTFYRDKGDEYITRDFNFTTNEASLISFIKKQSANGGGDFPEAVHSALDVAITQNSWNNMASSRIIFLLLDAPPHYTQEAISSLEKNLLKAAEEGIKIIPISASGIDKSTEYLMRSFAILTNGTYVFITDDSGVGNPHLKPTIGDFEVQKLNDLLVNLVDTYVP